MALVNSIKVGIIPMSTTREMSGAEYEKGIYYRADMRTIRYGPIHEDITRKRANKPKSIKRLRVYTLEIGELNIIMDLRARA